MAFIKKGYNVGDRVRIKHDVSNMLGTFTKGHEFTIKQSSSHDGPRRGVDLVDDDGNELIEVFDLSVFEPADRK